MLIDFFHRLFNPHCPDCAEKDSIARECPSCEILKQQLIQANGEKQRLLELFIKVKEPAEQTSLKDYKPTEPRFVPWRVRQQMLEQEDRERARLIKESQTESTSTEDLEKEMNIIEKKREENHA